MSLAETLTASSTPAASGPQAFRCDSARCTTRRVRGAMSPVRSARGTNRSGVSSPSSGWCQRTSALQRADLPGAAVHLGLEQQLQLLLRGQEVRLVDGRVLQGGPELGQQGDAAGVGDVALALPAGPRRGACLAQATATSARRRRVSRSWPSSGARASPRDASTSTGTPVDLHVLGHLAAQGLQPLAQEVHVGPHGHEQGELVPGQAGDDGAQRRRLLQPAGHLLQHEVPVRRAPGRR